jgi:hypothetical protein
MSLMPQLKESARMSPQSPISDLNAFLSARDFLLRHRSDYGCAYQNFRWPQLTNFNWALDYFDGYARGNQKTALWIVDENGSQLKLSYDEMSQRSNQVANFLRKHSVRRGDRIIVMLPNVAAMWEVVLAAMKLGAVIIPAATLLTPDDLKDRLTRGQGRHVITNAAFTERFAELAGDYSRIVVDEPVKGWAFYQDAYQEEKTYAPDAVTKATDPVFHLRHHSPAETGAAHAPELSRRSPRNHVLGWVAPRRRSSQHQLSGLGQARMEQLLRSVECRRDHLRSQLHALRRQENPRSDLGLRSHHAVCAADGMAFARARRPALVSRQVKGIGRRGRAAQS